MTRCGRLAAMRSRALKAESQRLKQLVADYALEVMALNRAGRGYGS
jgi:hypothetical protein